MEGAAGEREKVMELLHLDAPTWGTGSYIYTSLLDKDGQVTKLTLSLEIFVIKHPLFINSILLQCTVPNIFVGKSTVSGRIELFLKLDF